MKQSAIAQARLRLADMQAGKIRTVKKLYHGRLKYVDSEMVHHFVLAATSAQAAHKRLTRMQIRTGAVDQTKYQIVCTEICSDLYSVAYEEYDFREVFG